VSRPSSDAPLWALELVRDRDSRQPLVPFNAKGAAAAPPLSITAEQLGDGMAILDDALGAADLAV